MQTNKVKSIHDFGQSIWLDFFDRKIIDSEKLKKLIDEDGVSGVTVLPLSALRFITTSSFSINCNLFLSNLLYII